MQRGLSELWTTPSAVCLMASAGQTCAQIGSSQCMHTCGAVCTLSRRSIVSRWIMRAPAVRVALLARLHAGLAADAARVVDEERELAHRMPPAAGSSAAMSPVGSGAFETRTAQILNSGIFEIGSIARIVPLGATRLPAELNRKAGCPEHYRTSQ